MAERMGSAAGSAKVSDSVAGTALDPAGASTGARPNVLLVDDRPANLDAIAAVLEPLGARLVHATSADEALRRLLSEDFAVALLDIEMPPGMSGFEVARLIRARGRSRATPIIFVTARDQNYQSTRSGYEAGAVDVLYKPLDPDILRAKVSVFLELFRLRDKLSLTEELRRANARLRQAVDDAEEARAREEDARLAKDRFLATMTHEIRTPINAILGYAQLMELGVAGPVTDEQRQYLVRLNASSRHLLGLVNDILDLSKIEADEMDVRREPSWTGDAVTAALEISRPLASARDITLVHSRSGEPGLEYVGDADRVRQILLNLLSNAIKFTETSGTVTVDSELRVDAPSEAHLRGNGPWVCIRVRDTGIGIAAEQQTRVFDPFHQVDSGHTRTRGGTGLGLSISRKLARLMGGDLTLESALGKGSTFALWLPAGPDAWNEAGRARSGVRRGESDGLPGANDGQRRA
jgi:signal transduction histidine kinase